MTRRPKIWVGPAAVLVLLIVDAAAYWKWFGGGVWAIHHTIGVVIMAPAYALWAISRLQLGASFTGRAEARTLVTHGLYARIRNPIYLFGELLTVGMIVFVGIPWLALGLPILMVVQAMRARREARVLEAAFGDAYRAYRARTWM